MKTIIAVIVALLAAVECSNSQSVTWSSLREDQPNSLQFQFGFDYGTTAQLTYGRTFTLLTPMMFRTDFSFPMGRNLLDDCRLRLGLDMMLVEVSGFAASFRFLSNMRRFENELVQILNFGSDASLTGGYYARSWYAAGEVGFDKSSVSYINHSGMMRRVYPSIRDGWFDMEGGHHYVGLLAGVALGGGLDLSLRLGALSPAGKSTGAMLPYYVQVGVGTSF